MCHGLVGWCGGPETSGHIVLYPAHSNWSFDPIYTIRLVGCFWYRRAIVRQKITLLSIITFEFVLHHRPHARSSVVPSPLSNTLIE